MEMDISEKALETYGFEQDERIEKEVYEEFNTNYSKVISRRKKRWNKVNVEKMKKSSMEKRFVRKGIPSDLRAKVWLAVSGVGEKMAKNKTRYQTLLNESLPQSTNDIIMTDVPRTFPENEKFRQLKPSEPDGLSQSLVNVLKALAAAVPEIGYCQGLNFVGAILLLVVKNEEKAFWLLEHLVTEVVPKGYYTPLMLDLKRDCEVMSELVRQKVPAVSERLREEEISYVVICTKWFICMYCDTLPIETGLRILDCLFFEGDKILFRVALTMIKLNSQRLLECPNFPKLLTAFQGMVYERNTLFCHEFMENVFKKPGKLSRKKIEKLRARFTSQNGGDCVFSENEE